MRSHRQVKNVLTVAYAIFGGSCSATNQQLRVILGDRYVRGTKDSLLACLRTLVTEVETKVNDAEGIALWTERLGEFVQSDNIEDVACCVQGAANPEVQRGAVRTLLRGTGMPEEAIVTTLESWFLPTESFLHRTHMQKEKL